MTILFFISCLSSKLPGPLRSVGRPAQSYAERYNLNVVDEASVLVEKSDSTQRESKVKMSLSRYDRGEDVAASSLSMVGKTKLQVNGALYRYDCSGLVEAVYASAGLALKGNVIMMYEQSREQGVLHKRNPQLGDLVFFDNSYDRNKNGRRDDKLTHVGIVESIDEDGTITVVHLGSRGVVPIYMNIQHPSVYKSPEGKVWNSFLRAPSKKDKGPRLTGELFVGFGSLWKSKETLQSSLEHDGQDFGFRYSRPQDDSLTMSRL